MDSPPAPPAPAASEPIVGRVTPWYYRRMLMLTGMLLFFGLYFLYDGRYGYPKENAIAAEKARFENEVLRSYDEAKKTGRLDAWREEARTRGWPTGTDTQPPRWVSWAAQRGYPEDPTYHTPEAIAQQIWLGGFCILAAAVVGGLILLNRTKTVRAGPDHWITPSGKTIRFADVFRLDLRKWQHKGLGIAWYRDSPGGPERRAVLDDFKFSNMQFVLDRLRSQFKGELIEKAADPPDLESEPEQKP
ncbi:MAG TPA: hypothetical protein VD994_11285 [Prosthecobacter sp.]|nr:hypothetical protein [Prosthecobacter sp.]